MCPGPLVRVHRAGERGGTQHEQRRGRMNRIKEDRFHLILTGKCHLSAERSFRREIRFPKCDPVEGRLLEIGIGRFKLRHDRRRQVGKVPAFHGQAGAVSATASRKCFDANGPGGCGRAPGPAFAAARGAVRPSATPRRHHRRTIAPPVRASPREWEPKRERSTLRRDNCAGR